MAWSVRRRGWILLSKILDAMAIVSVLVGTSVMYGSLWDPKYGMAASVATVVFLLIAEIAGLYRHGEAKRPSANSSRYSSCGRQPFSVVVNFQMMWTRA